MAEQDGETPSGLHAPAPGAHAPTAPVPGPGAPTAAADGPGTPTAAADGPHAAADGLRALTAQAAPAAAGVHAPAGGLLGGLPGGLHAPTAPRMIVGSQLQRFREAAGVSAEDAGYRIRASRSKISRMENGRVGFKERDVEDLLTLYRVTDSETRAGVLSLVRLANAAGWWARYDDVLPDWFEPYLGLETAASVIRCFELQFVPGLFQTEDYARAVCLLAPGATDGEQTERRVALRMKRQELLLQPDPPHIWAIVDEGVLRRHLGGREVMRAQIARLEEVADLPHVTLQVVLFGRGGHAAAGGSFSLLRFTEADVPDVVYAEQLTSAVYLDKREDVALYAMVMDRLGAKALTPAQTRGFLTKMRDET